MKLVNRGEVRVDYLGKAADRMRALTVKASGPSMTHADGM